jgi:hypothetical protein
MMCYNVRNLPIIRGLSTSFGYSDGSYFCGNDDHAARIQSKPIS